MADKKTSEDEAFEAWQSEIRSRIPEDKRQHLDVLFGTDGAREVFKGGLREADYYRRLNDIHDEREKLNQNARAFEQRVAEQERWYTEANAEYQRAVELANSATSDDDATGTKSNEGIDASMIEELRRKYEFVEKLDQVLPKFVGQSMTITKRAIQDGIDIDPMQVIDFAGRQGVDPLTAYDHLTRDEREKRAAKTREDELAGAREEGRREERSRLQSPDRIHYPSAETGPSSHLFNDSKASDLSDRRTREKAAMEEWYKLQQGSGS